MYVLVICIGLVFISGSAAYPSGFHNHHVQPLKAGPIIEQHAPVRPTAPPIVEKSVVEMVKPKLHCPKNFQLFKDKCVHLAKRPVDFRCEKGFEKRNEKNGVECVKVMFQEAKRSCRTGFSISSDGDTCTKYEDQLAEYHCPKLYELRDRECVLTTTAAPQAQCGPGYRLVDEQCIKVLIAEPTYYCEGDGFELEKEFMRCVGVDWKPIEFVCPSGTVPQRDGTCRGQTRRKVAEACSPGQTLEDGMCVSTDKIELTTVCEGSKPSDQDENCIVERVLPAQQRCPQEYSLNAESGKCEKVLEAPLEPVCVEGVLDRSTNPPSCKFQESTLPAVLCPEDYVREGEFCVRKITSAPQPLCDLGFVVEDRECVRDTTVDFEPYCNPGYRPRGDTCVRPKFENAKRRCPVSYEYKFGQCTTTEAIHPNLSCAHGFVLHGHNCVSVLHKDPTPLCNCSNCKLVGEKCITTEVQQSTPICKDPFLWNNEERMCEYTEAVHADAYCPKGYTFKGDSKSGNKAQCTRTETLAPTPTCDKGYRLDLEQNICRSRPQKSQVLFDAVEEAKGSGASPEMQAHHIHETDLGHWSPTKTNQRSSITSSGGFLHGWS